MTPLCILIVVVTSIFIIVGIILTFCVQHHRSRNKFHPKNSSAVYLTKTGTPPIDDDGQPCLFEVDAVVTWVDSTDPKWVDAKQYYSQIKNPNQLPQGIQSFRFENVGELYYCLKGIQIYLPWIRTVYLVTMRPQQPLYLTEFPKVRVVHHDEIFEDYDSLPTFNSLAIETSLHRIDGLAEHFIYFNDDCFIGKPLTKNFFFTSEGQTRMFKRNTINIYQESTHKMLEDYGFDFTPTAPAHHATPLKKEYFETVWTNFPHSLIKTQTSRFRESHDIWMVGLIFQGYKMGWFGPSIHIYERGDPTNPHLLIFMSFTDSKKIEKKMNRYAHNKNHPALICINDVKLEDEFHTHIWRKFISIYEKYLRETLSEFISIYEKSLKETLKILPDQDHRGKSNQKNRSDGSPLNFKFKTTTNNFGDAVNKVFWEKIIGRGVTNNNTPLHYITTGSIMNLVNQKSIIFGTGFISEKGNLGGDSSRSKSNLIYAKPKGVVAVRGPKSRKKLLELGIRCPKNYGDPLILFPCIYGNKTKIQDDIVGIIPHYTDKMHANVNRLKLSLLDHHYKVIIINIEVGSNYQKLIDEINKCKLIISSSLHGVMMGIVYMKPTVHLEFSNNVIGGHFKFNDFFESIGTTYRPRRDYTFTILNNIVEVDYTNLYRMAINLIDVCPFIRPNRKYWLIKRYTRFYRK